MNTNKDWGSSDHTLHDRMPRASDEVFKRLQRVAKLIKPPLDPESFQYRLLFKLGEFRMAVGFDKDLTIGRSGDHARFSIPDPRLSKQHFEIRIDGEQVSLVDLDSKNGTFVNGEEVGEAVGLVSGDLIWAGGMELAFVKNEPFIEAGSAAGAS